MNVTASLGCITTGFECATKAITNSYEQYKVAVNKFAPKMDPQERKQFNDGLGYYTIFLIDTQRFISYTSLGVKHAKSLPQFCMAVPVDQLGKLILDVEHLTKDFTNLELTLKAKAHDDKSIKSFKNITTGMCALGVAIAIIGTGVGAFVGLSSDALTNIAKIGVVPVLVGGVTVAITHCASETPEVAKILETLDEIKKCLADISKDQSVLDGKNDCIRKGLRQLSTEEEERIFSDMKNEFEVILEKTQVQVDKGFDILKK